MAAMLVMLALLLAAPPSSVSAEAVPVGAVIDAVGDVQVNRRYSEFPDAWDKIVIGNRSTNLNPKDAIRTLADSSAKIEIYPGPRRSKKVIEMYPYSEQQMPENDGPFRLFSGLFRFLSRSSADASSIETDNVLGAMRKTDFSVQVSRDGTTIFHVAIGEVFLVNKTNHNDFLPLASGKAGIYDPNARGPKLREIPYLDLSVQGMVQTFLYYPEILNLDDLGTNLARHPELTNSLNAYSVGNLRLAWANYPTNRQPASNSERLYLASIILTMGDFERANQLLASLSSFDPEFERDLRVANAIRQLIAAAQGRPWPLTQEPRSATEWLAESYYQQSRAGHPFKPTPWERKVYRDGADALQRALVAAKIATPPGSTFGFGWVRRAELEFGFGRTKQALHSLDQARNHKHGNPQALALRGFLSWARNDHSRALELFHEATTLDAGLANAWLGLGLSELRRENVFEYIRRGNFLDYWGAKSDSQGLRYLEIAAAAEPERSLVRSYLGKAYYESSGFWGGNSLLKSNAFEQLTLAKRQDTNDPTPFLYSALIMQQENQMNEAVRELERSIELNDNRAVYRSKLLLDQDRAVRSANLAAVYRSAGMPEVSIREAARSVTDDYANFSAHLFLANSYDALRDPTRFNLRYETAWFNELLLANLLSPVGGTPLSQHVSQQEFSRLFERNDLGLVSDTSYRSDGQIRELASHYGRVGTTAWSLDLDYQHNDGVRPNNELDRIEWRTTIKQQLTAQDSMMLLTEYQDYHSGDNFQYYDPTRARTNYNYDEYQNPIALVGYHREWQPGVHTLFLGGRLENDQEITDQAVGLPIFVYSSGDLSAVQSSDFDISYRSQLEVWTGEVNQIFQVDRNSLVLGARLQVGEIETQNTMSNVTSLASFFPEKFQIYDSDFQRWTIYAYDTWEAVAGHLWLTAGLCSDHLAYPRNHRQVPISSEEERSSLLGPKAAFVWSATPSITFRGAFSRSLSGVSLDQSYRLEPSQLAGFNQSYRTIIPESLVGSVSAPRVDAAGLALDLKFKTHTYIGVVGEVLDSDVNRSVGVYRYPNSDNLASSSSTPQQLRYNEYSAALTINQLLSDEWSIGASYTFTRSELHRKFPEVPTTIDKNADVTDSAELQALRFYLLYNHPSGFFGRADLNYYTQENFAHGGETMSTSLPGDHFWQANLWVGYRLRKNRGDVSVGLLNVGNSDYRLNPLNQYPELPRERVVATRIRFRF